MRTDSETDRLVRDKIRMSWLNLHAREVLIQPLNGSCVALTFRDLRFEGTDLKDCVDQALEKLDGTEQSRFGARHDTVSHPPQTVVPTGDAGQSQA